jgi:hypothetical protein
VPHLPYGPPNVRLIRPKRLPQALRDAGVALVEQKLSNSTVKDLVSISDDEWQIACRRFNATQRLSQYRGRLQARVDSIAKMFGVTERTVRRWLSIYRKKPRHCGAPAKVPRSKGWYASLGPKHRALVELRCQFSFLMSANQTAHNIPL